MKETEGLGGSEVTSEEESATGAEAEGGGGWAEPADVVTDSFGAGNCMRPVDQSTNGL